jgi:hypothetical protein
MSQAFRLAGRRLASTSTTRTFAAAARLAVKDESSLRRVAPLLAATGLAIGGTMLYREVRGL